MHKLPRFDAQRSGDLAQVRRKVRRRLVHIQSDAEDDMLHVVKLGAEFSEAAGDFLARDENVVRPFDLRGQSGLQANGPSKRVRLCAARCKPVEKALEVIGADHGERCRTVAVRVRIARGELVQKTLKVVRVQLGRGGGVVAVRVAGD